MNHAILTTSWDDAHPLDLRLADLLAKYDIPATFYIPLANPEREFMNVSQIREIAASFDVGAHTYHHIPLTAVSDQDARTEILECKSKLEEIIGREVLSFCYPQGRFNRQTARTVREAGFLGARTTQSLTRMIRDAYRMGTTVHVKDWWVGPYLYHSATARDLRFTAFMLGRNAFSKGWDRVAIEALDFVGENGGIWHLWGHSWEIEQNQDWARLEIVLKVVSGMAEPAGRMDNTQLLENCVERT